MGRRGPFTLGQQSIRWIVNQTPFDGCMLIFNVNELQVRQRCSEIGLLRAHKICHEVVSRKQRGAIRDMYVCWKETV